MTTKIEQEARMFFSCMVANMRSQVPAWKIDEAIRIVTMETRELLKALGVPVFEAMAWDPQ